MLYIEHTNDFFCFPLSKNLISMLSIEHINEYIEHGYGYGLPSPLMTSNMKLVSQKFTSFTGVVPKSTGTDLYSSPRVFINLNCVFRYSAQAQ